MEKKPVKRRSENDTDIEIEKEIDTGPKKKIKKSKSKSKSKSKDKSKKSISIEKKEKRNKSQEKDKRKTIQSTLDNFHITSAKTITNSVEYPKIPENKSLKIISWNINGLRPVLKSKELEKLINEEDPDFICLNETKIDYSLLEKEKYNILYQEKYKSSWICPIEKKGYSGVAVFSKYEPLSIFFGIKNEKLDDEGRVITYEYPSFFLVACYTPNAGEKLKRLDYRIEDWDKEFFKYINGLKEKKDIILCGDLNVAFQDIDIYEAKGHNKTPGFTNEERNSFGDFLNMGYIDTFRSLHPEETKFSYFSKRFKHLKNENKGWRLDYFIVNQNNNFEIISSDMLNKDVYNSSDHIPIKLEFSFKK